MIRSKGAEAADEGRGLVSLLVFNGVSLCEAGVAANPAFKLAGARTLGPVLDLPVICDARTGHDPRGPRRGPARRELAGCDQLVWI